ncbi:MAG: 30S ribosomal protein S12 methylthiotransferase RimO [Bacteroidales bacterium]|nr:30S ribosomal protein S12 methylthiotransferase RimO [Bacteroidales bacterium]
MKSLQNNTVHVISLGCSKNIVDSEFLLRQIQAGNLRFIHNAEIIEAGTVIINTCGFIKDAKQESIDTILHYVQAKKEGLIDRLFVTGCLSERYKKELESEIPEVDRYFGVNDLEHVVRHLGIDYRKELKGERVLTTPGHYAYLKISEGCDRTCSFCAIPMIRGRHISKPIESIIDEARHLAGKGVKELILIAQDLTWYGTDLYRKQMLPELLNRLSDMGQFKWIRMHYAYPAGFPKEIIRIMKERNDICRYLDIPFQHISNKVLSNMHRNHSKDQILELIDFFRNEIPGIGLRTTVLVGHPGEGEKEFRELLGFIQDAKFERLGAFTYSEEENTFAAKKFRDVLSEKTKQIRFGEVMKLQRSISRGINSKKMGNILNVIIDGKEGDYYIGRTEADSPEVDNEVLIKKSDGKLIPGNFYNVKITACEDYDLYGEVVT